MSSTYQLQSSGKDGDASQWQGVFPRHPLGAPTRGNDHGGGHTISLGDEMNESQTMLDDSRGLAPAPTNRLFRDRILPKTVVPLAWIYALALVPAYVMGHSRRRRNRERSIRVAIESGQIGWTQVFFEELFASASEFFGPDAVARASVDREGPYGPQVARWVCALDPTHVVLDVRTPPQKWLASLRDAFRVSWRLHRSGIYPIVILTDALYRRQRWHAAVLTAWTGMVVTFADRKIVRAMFPHSRIRGPLIMPVSKARIEKMSKSRRVAEEKAVSKCRIVFIGNIYPPRSTFLEMLAGELAELNLTLITHGDKANRSNDDYWDVLCSADIIVTTTMQGPYRSYIDWNWVRQAVHRYSETFAAGTAMVGAPVDGGFPPFTAGRDMLIFGSIREATNVISTLAKDKRLRDEIAARGHCTYVSLIDSGFFWRVCLGQDV